MVGVLLLSGFLLIAQSAGTGIYSLPFQLNGKDSNITRCGQQDVNEHLFLLHPEIRNRQWEIDRQFRTDNKIRKLARAKTLSSGNTLDNTVTLPVVIHIIHNNGPENISDAQALMAIQHLNEAFANSGYYDPADGVNTNIQFCMAERDSLNNPTNGITRNVSPYTVMGGPVYYSDDQNVKNIIRWNPECYINIWVVQSIPGSVAGYAYLPSAHGTALDGIVLEAGYFGSSYPNDVVIIHEMGHYLGLYHTFEGGCTNNDCSLDGDRICDTPPDQSTASIACGSSMNSCSTDMLSGFASDQPDLTQDYMDYGNFNCMKVFTQGQSDRMNWTIQNVRSSLLHCKSCLPPCPAPVIASFSNPGPTVNAGSNYTFTNSSINAATYQWFVNGVSQSGATNLTYLFTTPGTYQVTLVARSANPLCDSAMQTISLTAVCPVVSSFNASATTAIAGTPINFTNISTAADSYEWSVNGIPASTAVNFSYTSITAGAYIITLKATNTAGGCSQTFTLPVTFTCPVTADFTPPSTTTLPNASITFTSTSTGATGFQWKINGVAAGTGPTLTYLFTTAGTYTVELIASNGICNASKTGAVYVTDKCGNPVYLFRKEYNAGTSLPVHDIAYSADGGSIVAGRMAGVPLAGSLLKLDASGAVQWSKVYGNSNDVDLYKVRNTQDGGFIAIGLIASGTAGTSNLLIVKTAPDGTLAWSRQLLLDGTTVGSNIIQSAEGDFYFTGVLSSAGVANGGAGGMLMGKLTSAGAPVWLVNYSTRGAPTPTGIVAETNSITVCGSVGQQGFLLQIAKTDGSIAWVRGYQSASENFRNLVALPSGYLMDVMRDPTGGANYTDHVYIITDRLGNISYSTYCLPFGAGSPMETTSIFAKPNGNFISQASGSVFSVPYNDFVIQEINPASGIVWSKSYNQPKSSISGLAKKPDNSFFAGGYDILTAPISPVVMAVDSLGNGGNCPANPIQLTLLNTSYTVSKPDWTSKNVQAGYSSNHVAADHAITVNSICQTVTCDPVVDTCAVCHLLKLLGKDTICSSTSSSLFKAARAPGCVIPVKWTYDDRFVTNTRQTDSTIELQLKQPGTSKLLVELITPCDTLRDSLLLINFQQPNNIDLGPDIQLCTQSAFLLKAGSGFAKYTWQDGSADSSFTAYFPGSYSVTAIDYCGNTYSDAILITQAPDQPFDLGPDTAVCFGDSIQLTASPGFVAYSWSPVNYAIDDPYIRTPLVFPARDTTYTCVAVKYVGCTVVDSIRITVKKRASTDILDATASFCQGAGMDLIPHGSWQTYLWSSGAQTRTLHVNAGGIYRLTVTDSNQCLGMDSIDVIAEDCRPGIHFPSAFTPNGDGKNELFRAIFSEAPLQYSLTVYNRWGEKVFETRDPAAGWDGSFKGLLQDTGGFAWYSQYELNGEKAPHVEKGVVILLR